MELLMLRGLVITLMLLATPVAQARMVMACALSVDAKTHAGHQERAQAALPCDGHAVDEHDERCCAPAVDWRANDRLGLATPKASGDGGESPPALPPPTELQLVAGYSPVAAPAEHRPDAWRSGRHLYRSTQRLRL
jgi:hypothetical protein